MRRLRESEIKKATRNVSSCSTPVRHSRERGNPDFLKASGPRLRGVTACGNQYVAHKASQMTDEELLALARSAAAKAYAPYSNFHVGCAIESVDGEVVTGANMENACYRLGVCAEQSALTAAQHRFGLDKIARISVSGGEGDIVCTPCGGCRQAIFEAV